MVTSTRTVITAAEQAAQSGASLRFLLLGDVGVGKSSFIDTFISTLSNVLSTEELEEHIAVPATSTSAATNPSSIRLPTVRVRTGPILQQQNKSDPLGLLPPAVTTPARDVSFVTLPGYSSTTNPSQVLSLTDDYLNHHLISTTNVFSSTISPSQLAWFLISGSSAHSLPTCAFYFVLYELKPIDILYMKLIHERVNLVPILTKADTLSPKELWVLKKRMIRQLKLNGIHFHTFGHDLETVERMALQRQWGGSPFVVSSHRDQDGGLFESELRSLVTTCLYDCVRFSQEEAARKVIAWRAAFGPSGQPAMSTAEKIWGERSATSAALTPTGMPPRPQQSMELVSSYVVHTDDNFTPPPPSSLATMTNTLPSAEPAYSPPPPSSATSTHLSSIPGPYPTSPGGYVSPPSLSTFSLTAAGSSGVVPPPSSVPGASSAYVPSTSYSSAPRSASEARMSLIIDPSNRPSEIMDRIGVNTVHTQAQGPYVGSYVAPPVSKAGNGPASPLPDSPSYAEGGTLPDIWEAAELGDLTTVQRHLANGASPDQRNNSRSTLLHRTAWQGTKPYAVMHLLISHGANVNLTNENGNTVLQNVLMKHDDPALIKLLLDNGAETMIPNKEGMNTLEVAALFNKIESVKYLLENDLSSSEPDSIAAALHRARSPDKKTMKALLKSWQGKEGEKKRSDLIERLQGHGHPSQLQAHNRSLSQLQNSSQSQITDGTSVHSFDTSKAGEGNTGSSKASSLNHEGPELGPSSSGAPSVTSSQAKHMSRFNLKTMRAAAPSMGNLFNRK
ncbi:hypothetical protein BGZ70_000528 [Mortierella alpina]|uniref:Septin-type G domain-containing protein n=1 Tax=Mortierella alpina TaxID=64518 RepID=A0A9P6JEI1_MORAP|nr:hypothetical protein BGZ70_000528 [Mortierella alpina]